MNVFSYVLAEGDVDDEPEFDSGSFVDDCGDAVLSKRPSRVVRSATYYWWCHSTRSTR